MGIARSRCRLDAYSCRASALRVSAGNPAVASEPQIANAPGSPCADGTSSGMQPPGAAGVSGSVLDARTVADPDGVEGAQAEASASRAVIKLGALKLEVGMVEAVATASCDHASGKPVLTSSSTVARLSVNGGPPLTIREPLTLPLGPLTLYLNRTILVGGVITQRALELSAPEFAPLDGAGVVLAEAVAGAENCARLSRPPTAVLEILAPADCVLVDAAADAWRCSESAPRTTWLSAGSVLFVDDSSVGPAFRFRGTSSTDPDEDITSWSIGFTNGTSTIGGASGNWTTDPPTSVAAPDGSQEGTFATLTVTDSTGQSHSDTMVASTGGGSD